MITREALNQWVSDVYDNVKNGGNNRQYFVTREFDENGFTTGAVHFWDWYKGTDLRWNFNFEKDGGLMFQTATKTFSEWGIHERSKEKRFLALMELIERHILNYPNECPPKELILFREVVEKVAKKVKRGEI